MSSYYSKITFTVQLCIQFIRSITNEISGRDVIVPKYNIIMKKFLSQTMTFFVVFFFF